MALARLGWKTNGARKIKKNSERAQRKRDQAGRPTGSREHITVCTQVHCRISASAGQGTREKNDEKTRDRHQTDRQTDRQKTR